MGKQISYVMELHGPNFKDVIYSKSYAIECLIHNREFCEDNYNGEGIDEWRLFQVWKDSKGNEIKREEVIDF